MGRRKAKPVESHTFHGMESAVVEQTKAAAEYQGEELTAKLLEPLGNINHRAGEIERNSPLFFGAVQPTLFGG
jgi:hypothetical protein